MGKAGTPNVLAMSNDENLPESEGGVLPIVENGPHLTFRKTVGHEQDHPTHVLRPRWRRPVEQGSQIPGGALAEEADIHGRRGVSELHCWFHDTVM